VNDAVEFGDNRERAMGGRLRREQGAREDQSREQDSPHEKIMPDYRRVGVKRRVVRESESGNDLCASQSTATTRINLFSFCVLLDGRFADDESIVNRLP
jgi:hypothetical protein